MSIDLDDDKYVHIILSVNDAEGLCGKPITPADQILKECDESKIVWCPTCDAMWKAL